MKEVVKKVAGIMLGQCRLCLKKKDLVRSHLLPASLWRGARTPGLNNPNPVIVTKRTIQTTSKQIKEYLLCRECEQRFNDYGEREVLRWIAPGKAAFPIKDRLDVAIPCHNEGSLKGYSGSAVGICTETLAYFALSILWRAAVHSWPLPDSSGVTSAVDLGKSEEPVREYLLGSPFPKDVVVVLIVCTDEFSRHTTMTPTHVPENAYNKYHLLTQGLGSHIFVDSRLPREIRDFCCVSSSNKWIFVKSCPEHTEAFGGVAATSKVAPKLTQ